MVISPRTPSQRLPRPLLTLWTKQDPHSLFVATAGMLLACTLVIDLVLHRESLSVPGLCALLACAVAFIATALSMGARFPRWVGLVCVLGFSAASVYFLSPLGDEASAIASAQELPILSLYIGWFVPRAIGRILVLGCTAAMAAAAAMNPLFWRDGALGTATAVQMILIALFCYWAGSMLWRRTEQNITTDQLTGALNRAGFLQRLEHELVRSQRSNSPMCVVVIDFDDFKRLNDTQGHAEGDQALIDTVARWREDLRAGDLIGRTGGDEFAILLDRTDAHESQQIMRRLRGRSPHPWSWGIAQARANDSSEALLSRADDMLYAAKRRRR